MNLTEFSQQVHENNVQKGFYEDYNYVKDLIISHPGLDVPEIPLDVYEKAFNDQRLALIMSEAGEAVEANRKNKRANLNGVASDFEEAFRVYVKDTLEDEIADIIIRCLDLAGFLEIDIQKHVDLKLKYNKLRAHKHGKAY